MCTILLIALLTLLYLSSLTAEKNLSIFMPISKMCVPGPKILSDLSKVTQQISGKARVQKGHEAQVMVGRLLLPNAILYLILGA